jgi:hypothetical protein
MFSLYIKESLMKWLQTKKNKKVYWLPKKKIYLFEIQEIKLLFLLNKQSLVLLNQF